MARGDVSRGTSWTMTECARELGIARNTVARYVREGLIPKHYDSAGRVRFDPQRVRAWWASSWNIVRRGRGKR